ncbi:MAG: trimethylamine methyltransferase family protein [Gammaproteobacteria bacterium]|nr:trimethylamine methyltransferase family protein [Gammaproteobacteria bacterium]MCY4227984.1 trimethylamine methyltransferase family protein [Gammaproteobacteria bacterium]
MARRSRRQTGSPSRGIQQLPLVEITNPYPPVGLVSEDELQALHDSSMRILEEIGLEIVSSKARELMISHGAEIDPRTGYVTFDRNLIADAISTIPETFLLHARNPKFNRVYGQNHLNFTTVASAPNSSDLDHGRRSGNFDDYCKFLKLGQSFNAISCFSGYPVEPTDLPAHTRHLDAYQAFIKLTEKAWPVYCLGNGRVEDAIEMICMARSISHEQLKQEPSITTVVNTNSPLKVDAPMLEGLMTMSEFGQPVVVTPFTLAGAMSPVTLAGALSQQNAEALGVLAVTQMVNPGAPAMYGGFTSNVDMKSGSPAFGTPEYAKAVIIGGQLARKYRIPYRTSNVNAANCVDAQAAWESGMSLWAAVMAHGNMIKHGAGWLEGGLCASFEKFMIDIEMVQMMCEFLKPVRIGESELAFEAIREVGAGGHFFGAAHTIERYQNAFHHPLCSDWSNFESWTESGRIQAAERANRLYKCALDEYQAPPLDEAIGESIDEYVDIRKQQLKPSW